MRIPRAARPAIRDEPYVIAEWIFGSDSWMLSAGIPPTIMSPTITVSGLEVVDIVSAFSNGIRLSQLHETVIKRFGPSTTFYTSSRLGLNFDDLLVFLEARNQLRILRGVVFPRGASVSAP